MTLTLLAPLIAAAILGGLAVGLRYQRSRQTQLIGRVVDPLARSWHAADVPSVLYFTGAACTICHTAQGPALARLAEKLGGGALLREIDIADQPELARLYRVMSLPTTIVLTPDGQVSAVNVGFATADHIHEQLSTAGLRIAA